MLIVTGKTAGGLFLAHFVPGCKSPSAIEPPKPGNYYTLETTYTRVDIQDAKRLPNTPPIAISADGINFREYINFPNRIDDYNFGVVFTNYAAGIYFLAASDLAKYDNKDLGTRIVGYKFTVRVKETGCIKELTVILKNTLQYANTSEASTMTRFFLTNDGTIE